MHRHYENVTVFIQDNWMRLDFNKDGHVSIEDLRSSVHELCEFMLNYDYFQRATEIKSQLYKQAIKYMKRDLQDDTGNEEREEFNEETLE